MDAEKLINLVNERKPLWDMTEKSYNMRDIQRKLWQEVAVEINADVHVVKNKWRGLRDTFRKELNKSKKSKSGDGAESLVISKWPYYKMLLFLSESVARRKLHGNVSPQKKKTETSDSETEPILEAAGNIINYHPTIEEQSQHMSTKDIQQPSTSDTKATNIPNTRLNSTLLRKKNNNCPKYRRSSDRKSMDDKFLETESPKLEILSQSEKDDTCSEYQFLMSLLPFLKAVPHKRQLFVRNELHQVFIEEEQLSSIHLPGVSHRCTEHILQYADQTREYDSSQPSPSTQSNVSDFSD
ncbi:uncharacterized protein LOC109546506 [Dendroctonus ponderosae]|uniref:MADF domain-containing protein n=1 Tax=Dendroctonus ponderosae TaxID=77166 RepID=U4U4X3_DENPD|nr:uncharacterized protein LOC109546506 [Dendroctonus ponderosae]ERL85020.1 hypothetical protein D910_02443 [Dendroctonus ponderosae]